MKLCAPLTHERVLCYVLRSDSIMPELYPDCVPDVETAHRMNPMSMSITVLHFTISMQSWLAKLGEALHQFALSLKGPGLLVVALLDSSFLSLPEGNDILIVMFSIGKRWDQMAYYVAMTTVGSIIGCVLLYSVGRKGGRPLLDKRFSNKTIARAEGLYRKFGVLAVVVPSLLPPPTPFKVFVLSAGVFRLNLISFVAAVAVGRSIRYSMWGILAVLYGDSARDYMQQNLPVVGIALFALLVLATAVLITYYIGRARKNNNEV